MKRLIGLIALIALALLGWFWLSPPADPPDAALAYTDHSYRPLPDLIACLRAPAPAGLTLAPNGHGEPLANAARGITVRIDDRHDFRKIRVWIARPGTLTAAEVTTVKRCTGRPDNR